MKRAADKPAPPQPRMPLGPTLEELEGPGGLEAAAEITAEDVASAQAWATRNSRKRGKAPRLDALLNAQPEEEA